MDHKRILAVFTTMLCLLQTASAQECNLPTSDIIKGLLGDSIRQVISTLFDPGFDIDINTVLQDFSITCLAVSGSRDLYKASSSLVEFSFTGTIQFAGGNPQALDNFNGCEANAKCFALFNIECDGMDRWRIRPSPFVPQSIRVLPDFNDKTELSMNKTRLDCGTCGEQIILDRYPNDRETNCFLCDEACRDTGLAQCTGLTQDDCCPFYENDTCVTKCSEHRVPNDSFDCVS